MRARSSDLKTHKTDHRVKVDVGIGHIARWIFRPEGCWARVKLPIRVESQEIKVPKSASLCKAQLYSSHPLNLDHEDLLLAIMKVISDHEREVKDAGFLNDDYGWVETSLRHLCELWRGPNRVGGRQVEDLKRYLFELSLLLVSVAITDNQRYEFSPMPVIRWRYDGDTDVEPLISTGTRSRNLMLGVNRHFFETICGCTYSAQIDLAERRTLRGDIAKSLHRTFSVWLRHGGSALPNAMKLESLVNLIYGDEQRYRDRTKAAKRDWHQRNAIMKAMCEIAGLPGWRVEKDCSHKDIRWKIRRLSVEDVVDEVREVLMDVEAVPIIEEGVVYPDCAGEVDEFSTFVSRLSGAFAPVEPNKLTCRNYGDLRVEYID